MKTLYISDLDGTLLNDSAELSEYTVRTLNRLIGGGIHFTVATARNAYSARSILERLELRLPVILSNGVMLHDLQTRTFSGVKYVPPSAVAAVLAAIRRHGLTALFYSMDGEEQTVYYEPDMETDALKEFRERRFKRYGKSFTPAERLESLPDGSVFYFVLLDSHSRLAPLNEDIKRLDGVSAAFYRNTYTRDAWMLDIFSAEASKANAALELKKLGGYDRLVGFGDNLNDLPLFAACDERCAVANAAEEVRAAATEIIGTNTDDGVARWMEERDTGA